MHHEFGGSKDVGYAKALFQNMTLKKCQFFHGWICDFYFFPQQNSQVQVSDVSLLPDCITHSNPKLN